MRTIALAETLAARCVRFVVYRNFHPEVSLLEALAGDLSSLEFLAYEYPPCTISFLRRSGERIFAPSSARIRKPVRFS